MICCGGGGGGGSGHFGLAMLVDALTLRYEVHTLL